MSSYFSYCWRFPKKPVSLVALSLALCLSATGQALNACDVNADGVITSADVDLAAKMAIGTSACTANIIGAGVCNAVVVQRVANALSGTCVTGAAHTVSLTWVASVSTNVTGYSVYRATVDGGPYTLLTSTPVTGTTYVDNLVQGGITYYYVVTAIDSSGATSVNSNQALAAVPVG